jgi:Ca-activated chloride channel family protein
MPYQRVVAGWAAATCLCLPNLVGAQVGSHPPDDSTGYTISADVDRVLLPITVADHKGRLVPNLPQGDFRVYDNGRLQKIRDFFYRDIPVTVGLVMDSSSSMAPKRGTAILAALQFVRLSNPDDEVFVVNFNGKVSFSLPARFSSDTELLRGALLGLPCEGRTALYDAITAAAQRLSQGSREKKALIVVSDGGDNVSRQTFQETLATVERSDAAVYAIGVFDEDDPDRNPGVLKKLAHATGGEAFFPTDPRELPAILSHVARVLRSQYTIVYAPSDHQHDGSYHHIRVVATAAPGQPKLEVRTRAGYYAPSPARSAAGARP